jgi:hypothetical protein
MDELANFNEVQKVALEHAWEWFSLHARQRMQSVYYFIVAIAFLFGAFTQASNADNHTLALAVSLLGGCVSYIFYRLEMRVRSLIHAAENALEPLENDLAKLTHVPSIKVVSLVRSPQRGSWPYSKVFRLLYASAGTAFALAVLYSVWRLASKVPILAPAFYLAMQLLIGVFLGIFGFELLNTKYIDIENRRLRTVRNIISAILGILVLLVALCILIYLVFWQLPLALQTTFYR